MISLVLLTLLSAFAQADKAEIFPSKINVLPNEGFTMMLQTTSDFGEIMSCKLTRETFTYVVSLTDESAPQILQNSGESMYPISNKLCGVRILGATNKSEGMWELTAVDVNRITQNALVELELTGLPGPNQIITTSLGQSVTIKCAEYKPYQQCKVYNTKKEIVSFSCTYKIDFITEVNIGEYTCRVGVWGSMYEKDYTFTIRLKDDEETHTSITETSTSIFLTCALKYAVEKTSHCRVFLPNGNLSLNIMEGLATSKYSTLGTKLSKNICVLQIIKPLTTNESGLWTMEMHMANQDITGCFFKVGEELPAMTERKEIFKTLFRNATLEITCSVPYPVSYCYIINPLGTRILPIKDGKSKRLSNLGRCQYKVEKVTFEDEGTWTCALPALDQSEEDIQTFTTVTVPPQPFIAQEAITYGRSTDTILLCKLLYSQPLQYCRFLSPTNQGYLLFDNTSNSRHQYYGAGLRKGECGIKLASTLDEDYGTWNCYVKLYGTDLEYETDVIIMREDYFATSLAIGLSVTFGVLGAIWIGYVIYKKRQRKDD